MPKPNDLIKIEVVLQKDYGGFFITLRQQEWLRKRISENELRLIKAGVDRENIHLVECVKQNIDPSTELRVITFTLTPIEKYYINEYDGLESYSIEIDTEKLKKKLILAKSQREILEEVISYL